MRSHAWTTTALLPLFVPLAIAQSSTSQSSSSGAPTTLTSITSVAGTGAPTITVSTAIASASSASAQLPSQVPLPPKQAWCPSEIFCAGQILQTINLAELFADPKTVVDKPTSNSTRNVVTNFNSALNSTSVTEGAVQRFVETNFKGEGLELAAITLPGYQESPAFLNNVSNPTVRAWSQRVHSYWTQLARDTNETQICTDGSCESSLIPLNHTFVVPGGRFREQYYWDSYWIMLGLLESELYEVANGTLQNFMDELEQFGFIPNGGRIYYLNRSQPPVFIHMLAAYVAKSNDTAILKRGLPLAEAELKWWDANRTVSVTSSFTNKTYKVHQYAVRNSAPRPESYLQDYTTGNDPSLPTLNETQRADLYAELASGAESGWDYSSRWFGNLSAVGSAGLRTLRLRDLAPVDLNSILYKAHSALGDLYTTYAKNSTAAQSHREQAADLRAAVLDLNWDSDKLAFYDYIISTGKRSTIWSAATFYPFWSGIYPPEVLGNVTKAFGAFSSINLIMNRYNGTIPTTFLVTGQQWDAPNAWPPHQHIALAALAGLPANISNATLPQPAQGQGSFSLVPSGQLGLEEGQLPAQPISAGTNASLSGAAADLNRLNGTVANGGNATQGEGWTAVLGRELANRYIASALCSWRATGGDIPGILPRLSNEELNITQSINNTGNMFEKFSNIDVDSAGRGGEYTVQAGFGWTNGVVLWIASHYGNVLTMPECPDLLTSAEAIGNPSSSSSAASGSGSATRSIGGSATTAGAFASATGNAAVKGVAPVNWGWGAILAVSLGWTTLFA